MRASRTKKILFNFKIVLQEVTPTLHNAFEHDENIPIHLYIFQAA